MGRFSKAFKKKEKRAAKEALKAAALINYRKAQEIARKQSSAGWGQPNPIVINKSRKKKGEKDVNN